MVPGTVDKKTYYRTMYHFRKSVEYTVKLEYTNYKKWDMFILSYSANFSLQAAGGDVVPYIRTHIGRYLYTYQVSRSLFVEGTCTKFE